jgi:pyruvate dehydrogenase E2 component (dihydrolipoamide acetyltransferase)
MIVMSDTSSLPYHLVVGLPALSPTMEVGTLSEWYKNEGDAFHAGDAIAKIETDKAAIDFEAQDDGVVAKILINANDGADSYVYIHIYVSLK